MRISYWSSDVCSSDLTGNPLLRSSHRSGSTGQPIPPAAGCRAPGQGQAGPCRKDRVAWLDPTPCGRLGSRWSQVTQTPYDPCSPTGRSFAMPIKTINGKSDFAIKERKSAVEGKRVSVRVDLGGGGI